jgi:hypothetical protein
MISIFAFFKPLSIIFLLAFKKHKSFNILNLQ